MPSRTHPISKAEFARRSGRSKATLAPYWKGALAAAMLEGGRVDAAHPTCAAWAKARKIDPAQLLRPSSDTPAKARRMPPPGPLHGDPELLGGPPDLQDLLDVPVGELLGKYGSVPGWTDWLNARKVLADTRRLELAVAQTRLELIQREWVAQHLIALIDGTFRRLLGDGAQNIVARLAAAHHNDVPTGERLKIVRDIIGTNLKRLKEDAAKRLDEKAQK